MTNEDSASSSKQQQQHAGGACSSRGRNIDRRSVWYDQEVGVMDDDTGTEVTTLLNKYTTTTTTRLLPEYKDETVGKAERGGDLLAKPARSVKTISTTTCTTTSSDSNDDNDEDGNDNDDCFMKNEIWMLVKLAVPTILIQLGVIFPSFYLTSYIGRVFGSDYLEAYTLANTLGNVCILTIIEGIYRALETLLPQSYGAGNYKEMQYITIRALVSCFVLLVPLTTFLTTYMEPILNVMGEDTTASHTAAAWYRIYAFAIPIEATFQIMASFLSAQHILLPVTVASMVCSTVVLIILLDVFCTWFGFLGTGAAILGTIFLQVATLLVYCYYIQPHHPETWQPIPTNLTVWKNTILNPERFQYFIYLGSGGILASAYWIYWEILCLMVGTLNDYKALAIHTIPSQVLTVTFMIPLGIGVAMTIRIGNILPRSAARAKSVCFYGSIGSIVLFAIISWLLYAYRFSLYHIFTTEAELIAGCEEIWTKCIIYAFNMSVYAMNMGIATSLGKQGFVGIVCIVFLFGITLPVVYYGVIASPDGGTLLQVWSIICYGYIPINITLMITFFYYTDWEDVATTVRLREGIIEFEENDNESLSLSSCSDDDDSDDDDCADNDCNNKNAILTYHRKNNNYGSIEAA